MSSRRTLPILLVALALSAPSCALFSKVVEAPSHVLNPRTGEKRPSPARVQASVMRFTDGFNVAIGQASREFANGVGTPEAKIQGLYWAISQSTAALSIACGSNPNANLIDMIVLVTLGRMLHQDHWMEVWGEADRPMLEAYVKLEHEIEIVARQTLTLNELEEVREAVRIWREQNPDQRWTGFVRLPGFKGLIAAQTEKRQSDVFTHLAELVNLDPLSGLKPATREVEQTRLFGERTLFYAQRAPMIFTMQAELLGLKLASMPQVEKVADSGERLSIAAEDLVTTANELPETIARTLEESGEPTKELLAEARATIDSGKAMSTELRGTIESFDHLVERFRSWPKSERPSDAPRGKPFDVAEYGIAAAKVGEAAHELEQLMASVEEGAPELERIVATSADRADATVDRITVRVLLVGLALIVAAAIASLAVRRISSRWIPPLPGEPTRPKSKRVPHEVHG